MNYQAAIAHFPKLTYQRAKRLRDFFNSWQDAWEAEVPELARAGFEEGIAAEFISWREKFSVEKMQTELEREGIAIVALGESAYPRLLAEIADPPFALFVRGKLPPNEVPTVAVVGTRKCTVYGRQVTEQIVNELATQKVVVISGLALGVDGFAHAATIAAGGATVAVLGGGINQTAISPSSHRQLAEEIIAHDGAIISEYPPGFIPTQYSFPARNRIIAGLSLGALITEAPLQSGALITAKCALDYNREVFAVPHPIFSPTGEGGNKLIKLGATPITKAQDILDALQIQNIQQIIANNQVLPATPDEAKILPHLSKEPRHVDALIKLSGLESAIFNSTLVLLEMKGRVRNLGSMMYILK